MLKIAVRVFAVVAVISGVLLAVTALVPGAGTALVNAGLLGVLAGPVALGTYAGGLLPRPAGVRVLTGIGVAFIAFSITNNFAQVVSLATEPGSSRDHLEHGVFAVLWLLLGLFLVWDAKRLSATPC
ncbi:hypothetical protein AB0A63_38945 [Lentzea sp. NPDC042327]|uniref:hypothetical protein n=1 Tax=Lentzea sp. NPDC042327 TaxID=3154801 RepID=UPI0033D84B8C